MRIATWNVNGLRARLDFVRHWLQAREPDVVCLQELKLEDDQFPRDELAKLGYEAVVHGQKAWNGVAVLSRLPVSAVRAGLPGEEEFGSRLVTAEVAGVSVTSVYVPNGKRIDHDDFPRKLAWLDSLDDPGFSWWDYRMGAFHRGMGLRIDFVLATAPITVRSAQVDRDYRKKQEGLTASDHAPVIVEFDVQ